MTYFFVEDFKGVERVDSHNCLAFRAEKFYFDAKSAKAINEILGMLLADPFSWVKCTQFKYIWLHAGGPEGDLVPFFVNAVLRALGLKISRTPMSPAAYRRMKNKQNSKD